VAAVFWPNSLIAAAALALTVTLLNLEFYRFYLQRQGIWFTLRVAPMHWLYFLYCGFSAVWGALLYYREVSR
jgi:hypothetical protein